MQAQETNLARDGGGGSGVVVGGGSGEETPNISLSETKESKVLGGKT